MAKDYSEIRELYSQLYFEHDKPIPFKNDLLIYPVLVEDYYKFYSLIDVFTIDKNEDVTGKGIPMTHLQYLFYLIKESPKAQMYTQKLISLLELIFHFENGIYCPHCKKDETFMTYEDVYKTIDLSKNGNNQLSQEEFIQKFEQIRKCPLCGSEREDLIQMRTEDKKSVLVIKNNVINDDDYDFLRKIVCYQDMLDYEDDYIDPELKAELEEAAKLRNPNNTTPSLEKQEACIIASTGYTFETIQKLSIRHLAMLLRVVDAKMHYMAYQQGEMSGLVKFEHEYPHWIYSNEKKSKYDTIQTLDSLKNKLSTVAK